MAILLNKIYKCFYQLVDDSSAMSRSRIFFCTSIVVINIRLLAHINEAVTIGCRCSRSHVMTTRDRGQGQAGTGRDRQGQAGTGRDRGRDRQGQAGTGRDRHRDRQGQAGTCRDRQNQNQNNLYSTHVVAVQTKWKFENNTMYDIVYYMGKGDS